MMLSYLEVSAEIISLFPQPAFGQIVCDSSRNQIRTETGTMAGMSLGWTFACHFGGGWMKPWVVAVGVLNEGWPH